MSIKYTVIVSAYNVEQYIEEAVNSVLNQSEKDFELIVINDCSTDSTLQILNKISRVDSRLRIVNLQNNVGLSETRNIGLSYASGQWILFLDGDDTLNVSALEKISRYTSENDLIVFGFNKVTHDLGEVLSVFYPKMSLEGIYTGSWNKAYKHSLIKGMEFPKGRFFEDMAFTTIAFYKAENRVGLVECPLLNYRMRPTSITNTKNARRHLDVKYVLQDAVEYRDNNIHSSDIRDEINRMMNKQIFVHLFLAYRDRLSIGEFKMIFAELDKFRVDADLGDVFDMNCFKQFKNRLIYKYFKMIE